MSESIVGDFKKSNDSPVKSFSFFISFVIHKSTFISVLFSLIRVSLESGNRCLKYHAMHTNDFNMLMFTFVLFLFSCHL